MPLSPERRTRAQAPLKFSDPRWVLPVFVLLLAFHVTANLWWLSADNHTIRTDEESHMHMARNYYEVLFRQKHPNLIEKLVAVSKMDLGPHAHPPLLHVAGALMIAIFGYSVDVIAATNTVFLLLALVGTFCILRRFLDPWQTLFAVFVVSFTPTVYVASRFFMIDYPSMAIVVWAVYCLLKSQYFRHTGWVFAFAVLNGLGILTRTNTFLYYLLPCALVGTAGLLSTLPRAMEHAFDAAGFRQILLNAAVTLVVSIGVFSPWYFDHLDDFYHYWTEVHAGGGGPIALVDVENHARPKPPASARPAEAQKNAEPAQASQTQPAATPPPGSATAPEESALHRVLHQIQHPRVPWSKYPVYTMSNNTFMVLFVLGLVGMVLALAASPYRSFTALVLLAWVLGSWVFMTLVLKYATPRYVLQAMPAFAAFGAIAVMAPRAPVFRRIAMGALAALLLFQYGNLTVHSYGPIARVEALWLAGAASPAQRAADCPVFYKDYLTLGFSYSRLGPPTEENYKDPIFFAMLRVEKAREGFLEGGYANYLRLNMRGMEFDEQHFWPEPNPYLRKDIPPDLMPIRRLRSIDMGQNVWELLTKLPNADYVVYAARSEIGEEEEEEATWQRELQRRNFELVAHFHQAGFGEVEPRNYGVMARRPPAKIVAINSAQDIDKLDFYDLYRFRRSPNINKLPAELQDYAHARFNQFIRAIKAKPFPINDSLTFVSAEVAHAEGNWHIFRFVFHVDKAMDQDWRIFFHGKVADRNIPYLPEAMRSGGYMLWNFDPDPPTSSWPVEDYIIITHKIQVEPISYWLKLGFFTRQDGFFGNAVQLGWFDFSNIKR